MDGARVLRRRVDPAKRLPVDLLIELGDDVGERGDRQIEPRSQ